MSTNEFDIRRILYVIYHKKWMILLCLLLIMIPVYLINTKTVPVFQASTKIVFDPYKGSKSITNSYGSQSVNIIVNQIEELKSLSMALEVARNLPDSLLSTFRLPEKPGAEFDRIEYIAEQIRQGVSANPITGSDVIKIRVQATSALAAKVIANMMTNILIKRNLEIVGAEAINVRSIIDEQLASYKVQLDMAELSLRQFKEEYKVTEINQQAQEVLRRITEAENMLNQNITSLDASRERLVFIQKRLGEERKGLLPSVTRTTSPRAQLLREKLIELQNQYTQLKVQEYADSHPQMASLRTQIEETKKNLLEESLKIASGETSIDPLSQIQKYVEESITLEIEIKTMEAQKQALDEVINNYEANLRTLPAKELRLAQLMREKAVNENIYTMLLARREEAKIAQAEIAGNIRIIDHAILPEAPIRPRIMLNWIVGLIVGLAGGIGLALILEFMDENVKKVEEVERITGIKVIGTIPRIQKKLSARIVKRLRRLVHAAPTQSYLDLVTLYNPQVAESEAFRTLRTNLNITQYNASIKVIMVTSGNPNEGKSFVSANLCVTTAQMGLKTLLIDADLRRPVLHAVFGCNASPGLSNLIEANKMNPGPRFPGAYNFKPDGDKHLRDIIGVPEIFDITNEKPQTEPERDAGTDKKNNGKNHNVPENENTLEKTIKKTFVDNLDFLPCGDIIPYPSEILGTRAMKNLIMELREYYDIIFIDTPPINIVTDAGIVSNLVDCSVLVLRTGANSPKDLLKATSLMKQAKSAITGIVVNFINTQQEGYSNYYYSYFSDNKKVKKKKFDVNYK